MIEPPTITMAFVANAVQAAMQTGIEEKTVLSMAGLTMEDIIQTKHFPLSRHIQLLESIALHNQNDYFGLHYGLTHHLSDFGILGYVLLNSATVGSALNSLVRYFSVWQQGTTVALTFDGDTVWLSYQVLDPKIQARKQDAETAIAFAIGSIRTLIRQHWYPKSIWLEHNSPMDASEYERIFQVPVCFNQPINAVAMERELLQQRIPLADQNLLLILECHLETLLAQQQTNKKLVTTVQQIIASSLAQGCPTLKAVAAALGMSSRTLQRHLHNHGVTFKQLVEETRQQLALNYLKQSNLSLTEIAFLLGYSELSAFSHAFWRWMRLTPRQYRQNM